MNPNPTRTLWLSVFMGVFAMLLIYSYSQEKKSEYDKLYGTTKRVVVATKDIFEMSTVDDSMVEYQEVPVSFVQPGAIETPEDIIGMVAASPIKKGEQMLMTKLLSPGSNTGLSLQIAPTKRAVTLPVDEIRGVAKLVRPGDRIDILASVEVGKGLSRKLEVETIMQDVVVLATGVNVTNNIPRVIEKTGVGKDPMIRNLNGDTTFSSVTIEATPKEAQDLIWLLSSSPGGLYFTLRHPNDRAQRRLNPSNISSVSKYKTMTPPTSYRRPASTVRSAPIERTLKKKRRTKPRKKSRGPFEEVR